MCARRIDGKHRSVTVTGMVRPGPASGWKAVHAGSGIESTIDADMHAVVLAFTAGIGITQSAHPDVVGAGNGKSDRVGQRRAVGVGLCNRA